MTDDSRTKTLEELTTEITGLKIRLRRIENFLLALELPDASAYIRPSHGPLAEDEEDELYEDAVEVVRQ